MIVSATGAAVIAASAEFDELVAEAGIENPFNANMDIFSKCVSGDILHGLSIDSDKLKQLHEKKKS